MIFRVVYKSAQIFLPFCHNSRVWQTDGQTEFSSLYRVCIPCSAVKRLRGGGDHGGGMSWGHDPHFLAVWRSKEVPVYLQW